MSPPSKHNTNVIICGSEGTPHIKPQLFCLCHNVIIRYFEGGGDNKIYLKPLLSSITIYHILELRKFFPVWLRNQLISVGFEPVAALL